MEHTMDGVTYNTMEGSTIAVRPYNGIFNGKPETASDVLMRTPSGDYYVYREWDCFPIVEPQKEFVELLDESAAREWAKIANDRRPSPDSDELMDIRFDPQLWDVPNDLRSRITVTLTNEVIAELEKTSKIEGTTISQLVDYACREVFNMPTLL